MVDFGIFYTFFFSQSAHDFGILWDTMVIQLFLCQNNTENTAERTLKLTCKALHLWSQTNVSLLIPSFLKAIHNFISSYKIVSEVLFINSLF